ncbi:ArsA family ATPase [Hoyosella rhizosphaerae]|uniref:Arsenite-transporting ATPase n=1 Tax=Hoyosella rhizosphaerae TaxID=1755582 RepID=A0A916UFG5_9ACTN|nr:ArsA family ATPase [Hoyosella rhizosphaerae]MBN4927941.1 ArsA family ATPase [Hoyosella rhizosphaerae]GGC71166.1 putative arsenite-transporting ATPase [Hoyosella rhizosphaerae]
MTTTRIRLFVGKGGVGKTTLAASTAVALARTGQRVLVVSTDQAHSLADAFGELQARDGDGWWDVADGVQAHHIDAVALAESAWRNLVDKMDPLLEVAAPEGIDWFSLEPEELTVLPGVEELLALAEVARLARTKMWDVIVLDCAPTAETIRLITLPETARSYVERLWPQHRRIHSVGHPGVQGFVAELLDKLAETTLGLKTLLTNSTSTRVSLVLTPERVVLEETRRTVTAMALLGMALDGVIVNRMLVSYSEDGSDEDASDQGGDTQAERVPDTTNDPIRTWYHARVAEQRAVVDELAHALGDTPLLTAGYTASEPVGIAALRELAGQVYGPDGPVWGEVDHQHDPKLEHESGDGLKAVYLLRIKLPLVDAHSIKLGRIDDDLVVGAAGIKRRVPLPSVLRRCIVIGARVEGSQLQIRFRPNPEVWPQW